MSKKRSTIKDVAELSGVSIATVSRVLSNSGYPVSADMRDRVIEAAKELHFAYAIPPRQSNTSGHSVREIALIVPNVSNPTYMQTIQGISSVCYEKKYQLILCNSQCDADREAYYLQDLFDRKVSGVIISSISENPHSISTYAGRGMSLIQLDQRFEGDGTANINYDSRLGAQIAIRHLIEKGHKRIAFASTPLTRWTRKELYKGYTEHLKKVKIEFDERLVFISPTDTISDWEDYDARAGEAIASRFVKLSCDATAVFCVNDMLAFGMISELKKLGKSVPGDISVIGVDNIPFSGVFSPPLTTIHCPAFETGRLSALMLIDRMQNSAVTTTPLSMQLQPTLIERDSVKSLL